MNYENQKKISIPKYEVEHFYNQKGEVDFLHSLSWNRLYEITRDLNGNEFKVWLYCMKWVNNGFVWYSPATLAQDFGLSESTSQRAFKSLELKGYLVKNTDNKNTYTFHPNGARM